MSKIVEIQTKEQLRENILNGVNQLADIVKVTLGARGRNISLPRPYGATLITKDGVSVAREVFLKNPSEDTWAQLIKEVASKTNSDAGDGTTTATVLAQAIIKEGLKNVAAGANPMELKKGIDLAVSKVVDYLSEHSIEVAQDSDKILHVATISANGDEEIGKLISDAFSKVGPEGVIEVEKSNTNETYSEIVDGVKYLSGLMSPHFITDFSKGEAVFEDAYIFICDGKIQRVSQIKKVVEVAMEKQRPIVFMANEIGGEALSFLIVNASPDQIQKGKKRVPFAAITAPEFGEKRTRVLEDIALITGGIVISATTGNDFEKAGEHTLGRCEKITLSREETKIFKGYGSKESIEERREDLRGRIKSEKDEMKKRFLENRLSKLNGSAAILYIGGASDAEVKEKADRVEDSINATRAATEEGVIPGGGVFLVKASDNLRDKIDNLRASNTENITVLTGMEIIRKAICEPLKQIVRNAEGMPDVVVNEVLTRGGDIGYDVREERYVDMLAHGIIDPAKVTRVALENAASVAGLILTTEGALIQVPNE